MISPAPKQFSPMTDKRDFVWDEVWKNDVYRSSVERRNRAAKRAAFLRRLLGSNRRLGTVIELGCGDGSLFEVLSSDPSWGLRSYVGLDLSETAIERARTKIVSDKPYSFVHADMFDANLKAESADSVIACGLLEHLPDIEDALALIHRTCKADGRAIFTTSNLYSMMYAYRRVRELFGAWPYGYQRNYSVSEWRVQLSPYFDLDVVTIQHGDWDFPLATAVDRLGATINSNIGRYIVTIAKPRLA